MESARFTSTERLDLIPADPADADELFAIMSDPAGWWFEPESRHTRLATTQGFLERAVSRWDRDGLSYWTVRERGESTVLGIGGVQRHSSGGWNLSYRLSSAAQGHGYAVELGRAALDAAHRRDPESPVIAWILETNIPSIRVAERIGLTNCGLRVDENDGELRLAYADRPLPG